MIILLSRSPKLTCLPPSTRVSNALSSKQCRSSNLTSVLPYRWRIVLGLTTRVAEILLWLAQGKTNGEIATILGNSESTIKKRVFEIFNKLGVGTRTAASLRALEVLTSPPGHGQVPVQKGRG